MCEIFNLDFKQHIIQEMLLKYVAKHVVKYKFKFRWYKKLIGRIYNLNFIVEICCWNFNSYGSIERNKTQINFFK